MNRIEVSANRRFLVREDGSPFFYLADTAWELFHRLTLAEASTYLAKRAEQGFTVIQAVALAELDGLTVPNPNGDLPLWDLDPANPNRAYFAHVDAIVAEANRLGLVVAFLPTWADKVNKKWGAGPEVFDPESALAYGRFLGRRYRNADLIWVLGGDRPVESDEHKEIWRSMATGLREGDGGEHLITFHPMGGGSSSNPLHQEPWLDFNMIQSGHSRRDERNWAMLAHDYALEPTKPCMDAESCYENHPVAWQPEKHGWFAEHAVRKAVWRGVFAGGHGATYGCQDVWQMADKGRAPVGYSRNCWHEVLALPAATQMRFLRALMESRAYLTRIPDQSLVVDPPKSDRKHIQATRDSEGSYGLVYLPEGGAVKVDPTVLGRAEVDASWFSPRCGEWTPIGRFPGKEVLTFEAPSDQDWVLVLDDPAAGYGSPWPAV